MRREWAILLATLALLAAPLAANSGWAYHSTVSSLLPLAVWISLTLLIETTILYTARPVRVVKRHKVASLQRLGWNGVVLVVVGMNIASAVIGLLFLALSEHHFLPKLGIWPLLLGHLALSVLIESLFVWRCVVFTPRVFAAVAVGNTLSYSIPAILYLYLTLT